MDAKEARQIYLNSEAGEPERYYQIALKAIKKSVTNGCTRIFCPTEYQHYVIDKLTDLGYRATPSTYGAYGASAVFIDWRNL